MNVDLYGCSDYAFTDLENGYRVAHYVGHLIRYASDSGYWFAWVGNRWQQEPKGNPKVRELAGAALRRMIDEIEPTIARLGLDTKEADRYRAKATAIGSSTSRIAGAIAAASILPEIAVSHADFDGKESRNLFNCAHSTIDTMTGEARWPATDDHITRLAPVTYDARAPRDKWERFLAAALNDSADDMDRLQRIIGHALIGESMYEIHFLHGKEDSGIYLFVDTIRRMLGDYFHSIPLQSFLRMRLTWGNHDAGKLRAIRALFLLESGKFDRLPLGNIKWLLDQWEVTGREPRRGVFTFRPQCDVFIVSRRPPPTHKLRSGHTVTQFSGKTLQVEFDDADLSGVLNWALEGLGKYRREGLKP